MKLKTKEEDALIRLRRSIIKFQQTILTSESEELKNMFDECENINKRAYDIWIKSINY